MYLTYVKDPELNQVSNKHDLANVIMMLSMRPDKIDWISKAKERNKENFELCVMHGGPNSTPQRLDLLARITLRYINRLFDAGRNHAMGDTDIKDWSRAQCPKLQNYSRLE
ncbi:12707_t:CDS:2 [Acaulospora morrowiae]|uniref:12707_t:CDS:1 n=1 Tax=Acaulospora morrowiae TaxID=94023 RepID=A0A9N8ZAD4_9GLOM|nr:12707_t:CDS:2 [Acaulospora morrowiae]